MVLGLIGVLEPWLHPFQLFMALSATGQPIQQMLAHDSTICVCLLVLLAVLEDAAPAHVLTLVCDYVLQNSHQGVLMP